MPARMGRPRTQHKDLPPGVRLKGGRYYWQPTSAAERAARRARGEKVEISLGVDPIEMRKAWARLNPVGDDAVEGTVGALINHYLEEELERLDPRTKQPRLTKKTRDEYRRQLGKLKERFGARRYARNAVEASAGDRFRRMDIVQMLRGSTTPVQANKDANTLSAVFEYARDCGLTEYNPVQGATRNPERPRDREALPWEVEVIKTAATPLLALMIRFNEITGFRSGEIRSIEHRHLEAGGIRFQRSKGGDREFWEWTSGLRAVIDDARKLRGSVRSLHFVFCTRKGKQLTEFGFQQLWRAARAKANRWLAEAGLPAIENLRFHDLRSKAIDDAEQLHGRDPVKFGSHRDPRTSRRHYQRRTKRQTPLE